MLARLLGVSRNLPSSSPIFTRARFLSTRRPTQTRQNAERPSRPGLLRRDEKSQHQPAGVRIKRMLNTADRLLKSGLRHDAILYIEFTIDRELVADKETRAKALNSSIALLFTHREYQYACRLLDRIENEHLPIDTGIRDEVDAMTHVLSEPVVGKAEVFSRLHAVFQRPSLREVVVQGMLKLIYKDLDQPLSRAQDVLRLYIDARGPDYIPSYRLINDAISICGHAGDFEAAFVWLRLYAQRCPDQRYSIPYTTLMEAAIARDPEDNSGLIDRIISKMEADEVPPNVKTYNALLAGALQRDDFVRVAQLYDIFMANRSAQASSMPNNATFEIMFRMRLRVLKMDAWQQRKYKLPPSVTQFSLRKLYGDLVEALMIDNRGRTTRRSAVARTSTLNMALKTFIEDKDYVGAFLVLRSFILCRLDPDTYTYNVVVRSLWKRLRRDWWCVSDSYRKIWAARLLGIPENTRGLTLESLEKIYKSVLQQLSINDPSKKTSSTTSSSKLARTRVMSVRTASLSLLHTFSQWNGEEENDRNLKLFNPIPLTRIIRRAGLAALVDQVGQNDPSVTAVFSRAVAEAKREMIPRMPLMTVRRKAIDRRGAYSRLPRRMREGRRQ
jgi:hypothetical protein